MSEEKILRPISPDWPEARLAARIDVYRANGVPWQAIAAEIGVADKYAAKRLRKDLERRVLLRQLAG